MQTVFVIVALCAVFVISAASAALFVILESEKKTGEATRAGVVNLSTNS